jgi:radical SAM-linked protein
MSTSPAVQRLRITFGKVGLTRFIGHLDVARTWERALNRAKLPVTYSQGYNRRPRFQFITATPLGMTSECEMVDVWLNERVELEWAKERLVDKMAQGITILHIEEVVLNGPALPNLTQDSTYVAFIPADLITWPQLSHNVQALREASSWQRERESKGKTKVYDLRPLVLDLQVEQVEGGYQLTMRLKLEPSLTGRPDEVLMAVEVDPLEVKIHRQAFTLNLSGTPTSTPAEAEEE